MLVYNKLINNLDRVSSNTYTEGKMHFVKVKSYILVSKMCNPEQSVIKSERSHSHVFLTESLQSQENFSTSQYASVAFGNESVPGFYCCFRPCLGFNIQVRYVLFHSDVRLCFDEFVSVCLILSLVISVSIVIDASINVRGRAKQSV